MPAQAQAGPGWGPPPPPGIPPHGEPGAAPKRRVGLMIGLIGGGVTMVLALLVGLVVVLTQPDSHSVNTPQSAAGLSRDPATERLVNTERIKRSLRGQAQGVTKVVSAVYTDSGATQVLFVGGESSSMNTESFVDNFASSAQNTQDVANPGGLDGKSVCGELQSGLSGQTAIACVWADNDTFGQFLLLTDNHSVSDLAALMHRMRPELEKKK